MKERVVTESRLVEIGLTLAPRLSYLVKTDDVIGCVKELFQNRFEIEVVETNNDDLYKIYYDDENFVPENTVKELMRDYPTVFDTLEKTTKEWISKEFEKNILEISSNSKGFYDLGVAQDDNGIEFQVSINPQTVEVMVSRGLDENGDLNKIVYEVDLHEAYSILWDYESVCIEAHNHPDYKEC